MLLPCESNVDEAAGFTALTPSFSSLSPSRGDCAPLPAGARRPAAMAAAAIACVCFVAVSAVTSVSRSMVSGNAGAADSPLTPTPAASTMSMSRAAFPLDFFCLVAVWLPRVLWFLLLLRDPGVTAPAATVAVFGSTAGTTSPEAADGAPSAEPAAPAVAAGLLLFHLCRLVPLLCAGVTTSVSSSSNDDDADAKDVTNEEAVSDATNDDTALAPVVSDDITDAAPVAGAAVASDDDADEDDDDDADDDLAVATGDCETDTANTVSPLVSVATSRHSLLSLLLMASLLFLTDFSTVLLLSLLPLLTPRLSVTCCTRLFSLATLFFVAEANESIAKRAELDSAAPAGVCIPLVKLELLLPEAAESDALVEVGVVTSPPVASVEPEPPAAIPALADSAKAGAYAATNVEADNDDAVGGAADRAIDGSGNGVLRSSILSTGGADGIFFCCCRCCSNCLLVVAGTLEAFDENIASAAANDVDVDDADDGIAVADEDAGVLAVAELLPLLADAELSGNGRAASVGIVPLLAEAFAVVGAGTPVLDLPATGALGSAELKAVADATTGGGRAVEAGAGIVDELAALAITEGPAAVRLTEADAAVTGDAKATLSC